MCIIPIIKRIVSGIRIENLQIMDVSCRRTHTPGVMIITTNPIVQYIYHPTSCVILIESQPTMWPHTIHLATHGIPTHQHVIHTLIIHTQHMDQ
jgi:hypothetical protein